MTSPKPSAYDPAAKPKWSALTLCLTCVAVISRRLVMFSVTHWSMTGWRAKR